MKRINYEKYRIECRSPLRNENISFTRSSSASVDQKDVNKTNKRINITKIHEKIKLTQKYRILSAYDPNTNIKYNIHKMIEFKLLNKQTSSFCLPSTGSICTLDEAIERGYVNAELIDESIESSNETYETVVQQVDKFAEISRVSDTSTLNECLGSGSKCLIIEVVYRNLHTFLF
jgi:hypothetical protein